MTRTIFRRKYSANPVLRILYAIEALRFRDSPTFILLGRQFCRKRYPKKLFSSDLENKVL